MTRPYSLDDQVEVSVKVQDEVDHLWDETHSGSLIPTRAWCTHAASGAAKVGGRHSEINRVGLRGGAAAPSRLFGQGLEARQRGLAGCERAGLALERAAGAAPAAA